MVTNWFDHLTLSMCWVWWKPKCIMARIGLLIIVEPYLHFQVVIAKWRMAKQNLRFWSMQCTSASSYIGSFAIMESNERSPNQCTKNRSKIPTKKQREPKIEARFLLSMYSICIVASENYRCKIIHVIYHRKALGTRKPKIITFFASHQMTQRYGSQ